MAIETDSSKIYIKTEVDQLNIEQSILEGNHYRSTPPHDWYGRIEGDNSGTFGQQAQPIQARQAALLASKLGQAPAPRSIRHTPGPGGEYY